MAETEAHLDEMIAVIAALKAYYQHNPRVYVGGNMLLYYEEGNPAASIAPDVFVVVGVEKRRRRTYKLWEEAAPPTVVIEFTSRGTRLEDLGTKRFLYASLGVQEYYLSDPLAEYLQPALQGLRLVDGDYERIVPDTDGALASAALGLRLKHEDHRLRLIDAATGRPLLRPDEEAEARRAAEEQARAEAEVRRAAEEQARAEAEVRRAAEARLAATEAELAELRAELARRRSASADNT